MTIDAIHSQDCAPLSEGSVSQVVFILGAGASRDCGGPLMSDFMDIASDLLLSGKVKDSRSEFEQVFKTVGELQIVHSKAQLDLTNIETIFTALELGRVIRRVPGLPNNRISKTINALKTLIVRTLEVQILFSRDANGRIEAPPPYEEFVSLVRNLRSTWTPNRTVFDNNI
jgi:hypothetical protein